MPAPTPAQIELVLTQALINQGFVKRVKDPESGALVPAQPLKLPELKAKEVTAMAQALSLVWSTWQTATVVTIPITSTAGTPSAGVIV